MNVSPPTRTITVTGHGKVSITPDEAHVQIGVQATAVTAREASTAANEAMNAVLTAIKAGGVAEHAIQTSYFSIRPEIEYNEGKQRRVGHMAANTVNVIVSAFDRLGAILDAVVDAGGDYITINSVVFSASEGVLTQAHADARRAALVDTRRQAELVAQTMAITLGVVLTVNAISTNATRADEIQHVIAHRINTSSSPAPIQGGEMDITSSVQVVYGIAD